MVFTVTDLYSLSGRESQYADTLMRPISHLLQRRGINMKKRQRNEAMGNNEFCCICCPIVAGPNNRKETMFATMTKEK